MKMNRIICIAAIIVSSIFVSVYGGNISYALFYMSILTPAIAYLYIIYVFHQFKLFQSMENYLVVKGEWNPYSFMISNEDMITFRNIKVNLMKEKATIESSDISTEYTLLPTDREKRDTKIRCNYRGEYEVGVESVEITDFLYLFTIKFIIPSTLRVVVLPRMVRVEQLRIAPARKDIKNPIRFSNNEEEELDTELRKYHPGDPNKRIHWKASARMNELISRQYQYIPKEKVVIFMDLMKVTESDLEVVITEDKIIESVITIVNYYVEHRIPSEIIFDQESIQAINVITNREFQVFYKACAKLRFTGKIPLGVLWKERLRRGDTGAFYVLVTHLINYELYLLAIQAMQRQNNICILYINDDTSLETKSLIHNMSSSGIGIYQITSEKEIADILSKEIS